MSKKINIILICGVIFMAGISGCKGNFKYASYAGKMRELNISMDYLSDWIFKETKAPDGSFGQVLFIENKKGDSMKAYVSVLATIKSGSAEKPATVDSLAAERIAKRLKYKDSRLLSDTKIKVAGCEGKNLTFSYRTLDKIYDANAALIPAIERIIIFRNKEKFYIISYKSPETDFKKYDPAFNHMLKSLKLIDLN